MDEIELVSDVYVTKMYNLNLEEKIYQVVISSTMLYI